MKYLIKINKHYMFLGDIFRFNIDSKNTDQTNLSIYLKNNSDITIHYNTQEEAEKDADYLLETLEDYYSIEQQKG